MFKPQPYGGSGGAAAVSVVQSAVNAGAAIDSVNFGQAPKQGNLLVAFVGGGVPGAGAGWTQETRTDGGGSTYTFIYYKIAGAGESVTQQPVNATGNFAMAVFEIADGNPGNYYFNDPGGTNTGTIDITVFAASNIIIGAAMSDGSANLPTGIVGATGGATAASGTRSVQAFQEANPAVALGGQAVTVTWGANSTYRIMGCVAA
jgi:hypothetical protein